ncbi:Disease resistance protein L6 [Linum grandiflorum]
MGLVAIRFLVILALCVALETHDEAVGRDSGNAGSKVGIGWCPSGWESNMNRSTCFKYIGDIQTWEESETRCKGHGGHLAALSSSQELDFVQGLCGQQSGYGCWVGGRGANSSVGFTWKWSDNTTSWNHSLFGAVIFPSNCTNSTCRKDATVESCTVLTNGSTRIMGERCDENHSSICMLDSEKKCYHMHCHREYLIILAVVSGLILTATLAVVIWLLVFRRNKKSRKSRKLSNPAATALVAPSWKVFAKEELRSLTKNFSEGNRLHGDAKTGGTYSGLLPDGSKVAVKRLKRSSFQRKKEFYSEIGRVARLSNPNLVSIKGCCYDHGDRYIVYDFIANGPLDKWLHHMPKGGRCLDWNMRMKIATTLAQGIAFLHDKVKPHVVHGEICASNVLLDEEFGAHLMGVGLSKFVPWEGMQEKTVMAGGTYGYLAPEFVYQNELTTKSDVYSFGVLLLEIVTGRRPAQAVDSVGLQSIFEWATPLVQAHCYLELLDPHVSLSSSSQVPEAGAVQKVVELVYACTQHVPSMRPRMSHVNHQLLQLAAAEKMRYIGGVVTLAALVFPMVILYKLWSTRRDSNSDNRHNIDQQDPTSSSVVTSYVMFDSEDSQNIGEHVESSSSVLDFEESSDNIHIVVTQQPPSATSPSTSDQSDNSNNSNDITQQQQLESPSALSHSADSSYPTSLPFVEYEVFLSFRGPDTRSQITEIIYRFLVHSKIHTFKDDDEMRKGEGIWPMLVKAINQSKVYVPILSEHYAHSKWCLNELAEIVKCWKQDNRRIILPIFYMVDPRDVRHQSGPYEEAFRKHEEMFDPSAIATWENALKEIGTLKGWHVKNINEQVAISDDVSEAIWSHVSKSNVSLDGAVELVGIDDHVNTVVDSLSVDSDEDMVMVGIHGTGGIGKTTLATVVYNKISARFDRCSFLENIRETQQHKDGTLTLQKKLISNILRKDSVVINDAHEGRKIIRDRTSQFKILVVLDDVDDTFKFDEVLGNARNFLPGSRFIATSRDIRVLRRLNREKCVLHEVKCMDPGRSLQLFCKHAFRKDSPPQEFDALSRDIVSTTGGLPLTLKVVGSLLYMEEANVWKEKLEQLKETTEQEVIERLKISYNALEHAAKQIFLDIACFFIGSDKQIVSYMWEDCNFRPVINIRILIQRSMIKIDDDNKFQMHDQLRDMGRDIVRNENIEIPWKRSRIWSDPVIKEMLHNKKGGDQVKVIRLINSSSSLRHIKSEGVVNMSEIRYLEASNVQLNGDFNNLLPNLRWLSLPNHTNDDARTGRLANLCMKNLVILDLRNSRDLRYKWDGWHRIKEASKLKVLDLSNCKKLKKLPRFPESGSIEILNLTDFGRAPGGELNIGKLRNLQVLKMSGAWIRKIKGGKIGMISRLQELDVSHCQCENLEEVLVDVEKLTCLKILRAAGVGEQALAGKLLPTSLKELSTCSRVPNLSDMSELETLIVEDCRQGLDIPQIDDDKKKLSKLHFLKLVNTKINRFATSVSNLSRLQIFNCEELRRLPSLANLENLDELDIRGCPNLREIQGLGGLRSLTSFRVSGSKTLTSLNLAGLLSFNKLKWLILSQCPLLASVTFSDRSEKEGAVVESMVTLAIHDCASLELAQEVLPQLCMFPKLTVLTLGGFVDCEVLTLPACLEELTVLELTNLRSTRVIKFSPKLRKLAFLVIWGLRSLREIEGLSEYKSLKHIMLISCTSLEKFQVSGLEELEGIAIMGGCRAMERPPSLANLPNLRVLSLQRLSNLREIGDDIADLKCLEELGLQGCKALETLPVDQLSGLEKLRVVNIQGCDKLSVDDVKKSLPNVQVIISDNMVSWILTKSLHWVLNWSEKFESDESPSFVLDDIQGGQASDENSSNQQ